MGRSSVVVIVNANARKFVENRALLVDVDRLAEGRAQVFVTRTRHELAAAVAAARATSASTIVLCGGDGSYRAGATAVVDAWGDAQRPTLAFAPGGTVGTSARSMGVAMRGGTLEGIMRVLRAACDFAPTTFEHATLSIAPDSSSARLGFIFGTGLVASFFERYDPKGAAAGREAARRGDPDADLPSGGVGLAGAAKIVARIFVESFVDGAYARSVLEPLRCDVVIDGRPLPWQRSSLVVASVLDDLGLGMRVTHRGREDPARPHAVVSGLSPRELGPRMPRVLRGRTIGNPGEPHFDDLFTTMTLEFPDGPGPYVIDGDLRVARRLVIEAGPRLRLLRPLRPFR